MRVRRRSPYEGLFEGLFVDIYALQVPRDRVDMVLISRWSCRAAPRFWIGRIHGRGNSVVRQPDQARTSGSPRPLSFLVDPTCTLLRAPHQAVVDSHTDNDNEGLTELALEIAGRTLHVCGATVSDSVEPEVTGVLPWTGGFIWESAPPLASYVTTLRLEGARVLELGAGTGVVGLTAALVGAAEVVLTDQEVHVALQNRDANFGPHERGRISVRQLQWGVHTKRIRAELGPFDVIVGSDLLYLPQSHAALAATIDAFAMCGTQVYLASPDPHEPFLCRMRTLGFCGEYLSDDLAAQEALGQWQAVDTHSQVLQQPWEAAMFPRPFGQRGVPRLSKLTKTNTFAS